MRTPEYRLFSINDDPGEIAMQVSYPCVVKPLALAASRGMEFVSPDAYMAAAFVIDDPFKMVESILRYLEEKDMSALSELEKFEAEHDISILDDIAVAHQYRAHIFPRQTNS